MIFDILTLQLQHTETADLWSAVFFTIASLLRSFSILHSQSSIIAKKANLTVRLLSYGFSVIKRKSTPAPAPRRIRTAQAARAHAQAAGKASFSYVSSFLVRKSISNAAAGKCRESPTIHIECIVG